MKKILLSIVTIMVVCMAGCSNGKDNMERLETTQSNTEVTESNSTNVQVGETKVDVNDYIQIESSSKGGFINESEKNKTNPSSVIPESVQKNIKENSIKVYTDPQTGTELWLTEEDLKELEAEGKTVADLVINDPDLYERLYEKSLKAMQESQNEEATRVPESQDNNN